MTEVTVALFLYMQFLLMLVSVVSRDKAHVFIGCGALVDLCVVTDIEAVFCCCCSFALTTKVSRQSGNKHEVIVAIVTDLQEVVGFWFVVWVGRIFFFCSYWFWCLIVSQGMSSGFSCPRLKYRRGDTFGYV